jgi:hypothetical protein
VSGVCSWITNEKEPVRAPISVFQFRPVHHKVQMPLNVSSVASDQSISDEEIVRAFAALMAAMRRRGIVRTKNVTGDLGERYAEFIYRDRPDLPSIVLENTNTPDVDALSETRARYSIKAASPGTTRTSAFHLPYEHHPDQPSFDHLIVVLVDESLQPAEAYEFTWAQFWELKQWSKRQKAWFMPLTRKALSRGTRVHPVRPSA